MKPSTYIMAILVFILFIMGGMSMIMEFKQSNDNFADDDRLTEFNETFNVYEDTSSKVTDLGESITNADSDWGILGVLNGLILAAWQSLKLLITNWAFMNGVFLGMSTMFGVPSWIAGLIILAITVMFVFALYSAFFQRDL